MMIEHFTLSELSARSRVELAQLERCLEFVPERDWLVGDPTADDRSEIDGVTAMFLLCAVRLLKVGCRQLTVRKLLKAINHPQKPGRNPLREPVMADAVLGNGDAIVQIADDQYIRWKIDGRDTGWIPLMRVRAEPVCEYVPRIIIAIDIASIRRVVFQR